MKWTVKGVLICPVCTLIIGFEGTPEQLQQAVTLHTRRCTEEDHQ